MLEEPVKRRWEIAAPLETVWQATIQSLVDKGVLLSIVDREDHLIVAKEILEGEGIKHLTIEKFPLKNGTAQITLLLSEKSENKTDVQITCIIEGFTGTHDIYVTSNGKLEKDYFFLITNNLPRKKHYDWLEEEEENGKERQEKEELN